MSINIVQELINAGTKYKKELLAMPVTVLAEKVFPFITLVPGVQGRVVGGVLSTNAELRPYRTDKDASDNTEITKFEWETYLGDVVKEFDPQAILGSLYTESTAVKPDQRAIAKRVALEMARKVGDALYRALFVAVRNASGNNTVDLFNGYSTLIANGITAGTIATGNKNYLNKSGEQITRFNAGDILKELWRSSDDLLKDQDTLMYLPFNIFEMYEDWYVDEYGQAAPWNNGNAPKLLVGSNGKCTLVPMGNMGGQPYIFLTVKDNVKVGVDQMSDTEKVEIRRVDNPKVVQFFMMAYFGVGFETFDYRYFKAMKFTDSAVVPVDDLANTVKTDTTATLTWTAADGATAVTLQQSTDGENWTNCATAAAITPASTTAQVTGLTAETEYDFRLVVTDGQNAGISNIVTVTTNAA